ncbi:MAG: hypothetical protein SGJ05_02725 [bacterium]|nr:hypothetical protein [bacterium]
MLTNNFGTGSCITDVNGTLSLYEGTARYSAQEVPYDFSLVAHATAGNLLLSTRNYDKAIQFATTPTIGADDIVRLIIKPSGYVGINQSDPKELLQIGHLMTFNEYGFMGFNAYWDGSNMKNMYANRASVTMGLGDARVGIPELFVINVDEQSTSNATIFGTFKGMCISTVGDMGVGTLAPKSKLHVFGDVTIGVDRCTASVSSGINYRLSVDGAIFAKEIWVKVSDWADYVFDPNYNLMPLADLQDFVNENRHLPGVPNAEEVAKDGISVSEVQKNLLLKVEELTLYILQLSKQNETLQQEFAAIKKQLSAQSSK